MADGRFLLDTPVPRLKGFKPMFQNSHEKLIVWQKAMELVVRVYKLQKEFPKHEIYALCDQLRRAVVSIPCNIAEGNARQHEKERRQFFHVSLGSLAEVRTLLEIAKRLNYVFTQVDIQLLENEILPLCEETSRLLSGLIGSNVSGPGRTLPVGICHLPSAISGGE